MKKQTGYFPHQFMMTESRHRESNDKGGADSRSIAPRQITFNYLRGTLEPTAKNLRIGDGCSDSKDLEGLLPLNPFGMQGSHAPLSEDAQPNRRQTIFYA